MAVSRGIKQRLNRSYYLFLLWLCGIALTLLHVFVPYVHATNPCSASQFWVVHADGTTLCEDCGSCPPGQGLSHKCGKQISSNAMVTCVSCQAGISFSSEYDMSRCTPCGASCSEDQVVLQNCTPTMNVKCNKQCYSKDRYYDYLGSCLQCSKCCGSGQDVIENECKRKLGTVSNMICSFHSSVNRCSLTTTKPSVKETTAIISTSEQPSPHHRTRASSSITHKNSGTIPSDGQSSPHPTKAKHSDQLIINVSAAVAVIIWLAASVYYFNLWRRSSSSSLWLKKGDQYSAKETQGSVYVSLNAGEKLLKSDHDKEKLEAARTESCEPLLKTDSTKDSKNLACKDSKLLSSLLNKDTTLQRICEVFDTPVPGGSNYKAVAKHYGFDHYQIASVLENNPNPEGSTRTRAMIESLAATCPDLTVESFATVVEQKTIRNDVVNLLRAYDLTEENNL